jgi:hypothetical protein
MARPADVLAAVDKANATLRQAQPLIQHIAKAQATLEQARKVAAAHRALERLLHQMPPSSEPAPFITSPGQMSRRVVYVRVMVCRAGTRRHVTYRRGRRVG